MTLLVGIRCSDGIVVAADRAVTFGSRELQTISHLACKISVLKCGLIVAGTGQVGVKQRFCEVVEKAWNEQIAGKKMTPVEMGRVMCMEGVKDFGLTGLEQGAFGALVAFPNTKNGPQLCEFQTSNFQPELKDDGTWFVSMGSGQLIADSYLAFMRDAFWKDGRPDLKHGIFAAAWVTRQSIRVAPGFIAEPIDIAVLQGDKAHMLGAGELAYYMDVADQATQHFGTFDPSSPSGDSKDPALPVLPIPEPPKR